jgi:hypothetical protein
MSHTERIQALQREFLRMSLVPSKIAKTACVAELDNSDCATNVQSNMVLSGVPAVKPLCSDDNPACKVRHQATSATLGLCRSFIAGERWRG